MSSWSRCRGILDVQWRCVGGVALWRHVEVIRGPLRTLFPFFPSLSLPSKLPSCSLPFHSLSFFLFPPCQSPRFKTLSCQFSPPNMPFILLFYRPDSPFLPSPFYSSSLSHPSFSPSFNVSYLIPIIIFLFYLPSLPHNSLLSLLFLAPSYFLLLRNTLHSASFPFPSSLHLFSVTLFLFSFGQSLSQSPLLPSFSPNLT